MAAEASAAETKTPEVKASKEKFVKYRGPSTVRTISKEDFLASGVADQEGATWERSHATGEDGIMPLSHFNDKAVEVLRRDSNFIIE
jgi:hypothetical protein